MFTVFWFNKQNEFEQSVSRDEDIKTFFLFFFLSFRSQLRDNPRAKRFRINLLRRLPLYCTQLRPIMYSTYLYDVCIIRKGLGVTARLVFVIDWKWATTLQTSHEIPPSPPPPRGNSVFNSVFWLSLPVIKL
jgi:hypothetical protein